MSEGRPCPKCGEPRTRENSYVRRRGKYVWMQHKACCLEAAHAAYAATKSRPEEYVAYLQSKRAYRIERTRGAHEWLCEACDVAVSFQRTECPFCGAPTPRVPLGRSPKGQRRPWAVTIIDNERGHNA